MKTFFLFVLAFFAVSQAKAVTLTAANLDRQITIGFTDNGSTPSTMVHEFNLLISVDNGAAITQVSMQPESQSGYRNISIEPACGSPEGTPVLGTGSVVIRMISLFDGEVNVPPVMANLFSITVDKDCAMVISPETACHPGIVAEDGSTLTVSPVEVNVITIPDPPTGFTASQGTYAAKNVLTWTAAPGATAYDVYYNIKNDSATAVLLASDIASTTYNHATNHGETIWYWVKAKNAAGVFAISNSASGWLTECYPNTNPSKKSRWISYGRLDCWCYPRNCKGDADGLPNGKSPAGPYWVSVHDLSILKSAWQKWPGLVISPDAIGNAAICADFDRASQGKTPPGAYAVSVADLNILKSNWNIVNGPAPGCEANKSVVPASGPIP